MKRGAPCKWTEHTFKCEWCDRLAYASQESIDESRDNDPSCTDAEIANSFSICLGCLGENVTGEYVAVAEPPALETANDHGEGSYYDYGDGDR